MYDIEVRIVGFGFAPTAGVRYTLATSARGPELHTSLAARLDVIWWTKFDVDLEMLSKDPSPQLVSAAEAHRSAVEASYDPIRRSYQVGLLVNVGVKL